MINLSALSQYVSLVNQSNLLVTDLIKPESQNILISNFPDLNFINSELNATHYAVDKRMTFKHGICTLEMNEQGFVSVNLNDPWKNFLRTVTGNEYLSHLGDITKMDLTHKRREISFTRYCHGDWLDAHYDKQANNLVSQLFYFNSYWGNDWGGYLHILEPSNPTLTRLTIPPLINYSVIVLAKNDAWHSVSKVQPCAESPRLAMVLQFYDA